MATDADFGNMTVNFLGYYKTGETDLIVGRQVFTVPELYEMSCNFKSEHASTLKFFRASRLPVKIFLW